MKTVNGGYFKRLLRVNLSKGTVESEIIPDSLLHDYIGGRGLGSKLLFDEIPAGTDPLSTENILMFLTGPLTGINAPATNRFTVVSKSPLTGTVGGCSAGGHFGADLKSAGTDVLLIEGKSQSPCYILIWNNKAEICNATNLWGKNTAETTDYLLSISDPKAGIACIGPAGEKQVLMATIMNEKNHAAGRGGLGAVMGSKKLKAVVVNGDNKTPVKDQAMVENAIKKWRTFIGEAPMTKDILKEYGDRKSVV